MVEYSFRPPVSKLLTGFFAILFSIFMGYIFFQIESWERIMIILVCIFNLVYGLWLIIAYSRNINLGNLEFGADYLKIPLKGEKSFTILLNEMKEIAILDYPTHSILFRSENESYLLKKNWMVKKDYYELVEKLKRYFPNTKAQV
ncbi:hypothetical protein [Maribacter sp. 2307UL18-2]|uniref:hypothetical protein n=1 Tax=Maribacter sp. 2307UL18-2 TaxID=3386274 RepID=UPI0039BD8D18